MAHSTHIYSRDCWRCRAVDQARTIGYVARDFLRGHVLFIVAILALVALAAWGYVGIVNAAISAGDALAAKASPDARLVAYAIIIGAFLNGLIGRRK